MNSSEVTVRLDSAHAEAGDAKTPREQAFLERDAGIYDGIGHVALTSQIPAEICEALLLTLTELKAPMPPLMLLREGFSESCP